MTVVKFPGPGRGKDGVHEATMPPSTLDGLLDSVDQGIAVLSDDADLLETVCRVGDGHPALVVVDGWAALLDAVACGRCGVVLLDADKLGSSFDQRLAELEKLEAPPVIVAAGSGSEAPTLMKAQATMRIHRLLVKPASPGKVRLALEAAINRSRQPREAARMANVSPSVQAQPRRAASSSAAGRRGLVLGAGMLLVFAVVVVAGLMWSRTEEASPVTAVAPPPVPAGEVVRVAPPETPAGEVEPDAPPPAPEAESPAGLLTGPQAGSLAMGESETPAVTESAPQGAAAADPAPVVAETAPPVVSPPAPVATPAPAEAVARRAPPAPEPVVDPVVEPVDEQLAAVQAALEAGEPGPAALALAEARELGADAEVVADLEWRLESLRTALREEREGLLLARAQERLRENRLMAPELDNAVHYLVTLRAENPAHPGLGEPSRAVAERLAANVRAAIVVADLGAAEYWLGGLERVGEPALVAAVTREFTVTQRRERFLGEAVPADELVLLESRAPVYPPPALRRELQGWVDLEYIVGADGVPREITVVGADPPGAFDRAASNAVERYYRYAPYELDGVVYERRVRLRMRFTLK